MIITSTVFERSTCVTDKRTGGDSIIARYSIGLYAVAR